MEGGALYLVYGFNLKPCISMSDACVPATACAFHFSFCAFAHVAHFSSVFSFVAKDYFFQVEMYVFIVIFQKQTY